MSCGGNFRGRCAARADGPNRFVRNQNTGELVRGQRAGASAELAAEHLFGKTSVAVLLRFSQANNRRDATSQRHQGLLGDIVIRLTKKLAALGVADDDVAAAGFGKHGSGNFACEGAFLAPGHVLTGDGDAGAFRGFYRSSYCSERRRRGSHGHRRSKWRRCWGQRRGLWPLRECPWRKRAFQILPWDRSRRWSWPRQFSGNRCRWSWDRCRAPSSRRGLRTRKLFE